MKKKNPSGANCCCCPLALTNLAVGLTHSCPNLCHLITPFIVFVLPKWVLAMSFISN
jgi:hypothetical protein